MSFCTVRKGRVYAALLACLAQSSSVVEAGSWSSSLQLFEGWNLKQVPGASAGRLVEFAEEYQLRLWPAHSIRVPSSAVGVSDSLSTNGWKGAPRDHDLYWIWSDIAARVTFEGEGRVAPSLASFGPEGGWQFWSVAATTLYDEATAGRVLRWSAREQKYVRLHSGDRLHPGEGYWARPLSEILDAGFEESGVVVQGLSGAPKRPQPPQKLEATSTKDVVRLRWRVPKLFVDGSQISEVPAQETGELFFRVYRNGKLVAAVKSPEYQERVLELGRVYRYRVGAVWSDPGQKTESVSSAPIDVDVFEADDNFTQEGEGGVGVGLAVAEAGTLIPRSQKTLIRAAPDDPVFVAVDAQFFEARPSMAPNVSDNYNRAILSRDGLLRMKVDEATGQQWYYQVEYEPHSFDEEGKREDGRALDPALWDMPEYRDSKHLAGFERVWAYTQGITLGQFSRQPKVYGTQSLGMAQYLCRHAVRDPSRGVILGWPFSWNTKNDDWKDARLVTGATAWVVHGLGSFLASDSFLKAPQDVRVKLRACYLDALQGLKDHRNEVRDERGRAVVLMSAGWSVAGLEQVAQPANIVTDDGRAPTQDPRERLAYYSVLDAVGYPEFAPTEVQYCVQSSDTDCGAFDAADPSWKLRSIDDESHWRAMKERVRAQNVVTEHNLDVLSVLNGALKNVDRLGPLDPERRTVWENDLKVWRNTLRDGIFYVLWDAKGWKKEFVEELGTIRDRAPTRIQTEAQKALVATREKQMGNALATGDLGRVITGGALRMGDAEAQIFVPSTHSAIDNCSWLALSVDYDALGGHRDGFIDSEYVTRLAACLRYTVLQYVKDLPFGTDGCEAGGSSCPVQKTYRGAHYFQNDFRDSYIQPSELQASSYHLEATMGLILGLNRFVRAYPQHPASGGFLEQAQHLWASAQMFVRDHGFVYSSQRIQDLSAVLVSSTATIWFIDVYDELEQSQNQVDRLIKSRSEPGDLLSNRQAMESMQANEFGGEAGTLEQPFGPVELGLRTVFVNGKARTKVMQSLVRQVDELLALPPPLFAAALGSMVAVGHLSSGLTDAAPGLETIFLGSDTPSGKHWEPVGFIFAEDIMAAPLRTYVRDEVELRQHVTLYPGSVSSVPAVGSGRSFEEDRIYYFQVDQLGLDQDPFGHVRILLPEPGAQWRVYALKTSEHRSAILDRFVQHHPRWKKAQAGSGWLPDPIRNAWLSLVAISARADFDRSGAEASVTNWTQESGFHPDDGILSSLVFSSGGDQGKPVLPIPSVTAVQGEADDEFTVQFHRYDPVLESDYDLFVVCGHGVSYLGFDLSKRPPTIREDQLYGGRLRIGRHGTWSFRLSELMDLSLFWSVELQRSAGNLLDLNSYRQLRIFSRPMPGEELDCVFLYLKRYGFSKGVAQGIIEELDRQKNCETCPLPRPEGRRPFAGPSSRPQHLKPKRRIIIESVLVTNAGVTIVLEPTTEPKPKSVRYYVYIRESGEMPSEIWNLTGSYSGRTLVPRQTFNDAAWKRIKNAKDGAAKVFGSVEWVQEKDDPIQVIQDPEGNPEVIDVHEEEVVAVSEPKEAEFNLDSTLDDDLFQAPFESIEELRQLFKEAQEKQRKNTD